MREGKAMSNSLKNLPNNVILGKWNTKVGSQEIPRVASKFGLGVQNEAGKG